LRIGPCSRCRAHAAARPAARLATRAPLGTGAFACTSPQCPDFIG